MKYPVARRRIHAPKISFTFAGKLCYVNWFEKKWHEKKYRQFSKKMQASGKDDLLVAMSLALAVNSAHEASQKFNWR